MHESSFVISLTAKKKKKKKKEKRRKRNETWLLTELKLKQSYLSI
jgi:hypothetical protein